MIFGQLLLTFGDLIWSHWECTRVFLNGPSFHTISKYKTVDFSRIWTRIIGVEGVHTDHMTTTTDQYITHYTLNILLSFQEWFSRQRLIFFIMLVNLSLAILFFKLLTWWKTCIKKILICYHLYPNMNFFLRNKTSGTNFCNFIFRSGQFAEAIFVPNYIAQTHGLSSDAFASSLRYFYWGGGKWRVMNLILVGKLFLFYERINLLSLQCRYKKVQLIVSFLVFGIFKSILF